MNLYLGNKQKQGSFNFVSRTSPLALRLGNLIAGGRTNIKIGWACDNVLTTKTQMFVHLRIASSITCEILFIP